MSENEKMVLIMPEHDEHSHNHFDSFSGKKLLTVLIINAVFFIVEVAGALISGSLAILADAGHMLTDILALALALFVATLARRKPTPKRTFGLLRAEVLGAFVNGAMLVVVVAYIYKEAIYRLKNPPDIDFPVMLIIGIIGLAANVLGVWILSGNKNESINTKAAFLHLMADALGSVGVIAAAIIIGFTGWKIFDPIISMVIGLIIFVSSLRLISQTIKILLESTPENMDYNDIKKSILAIEHVTEVHDLHIWMIATGMPLLSVHVRLSPECTDTSHWQKCLKDIQDMLCNDFDIVHSTVQIEPENYMKDGRQF